MATIPLSSISARARKGLVVRQFIVNFLKVFLCAIQIMDVLRCISSIEYRQ
jgi:hypothetical protein